MERIICVSVAVLIAVVGLTYLIKLLILKFTGFTTKAQIIAVKEPRKGVYVHTLRFLFDGKTVEKDDKTGYSQPFSKGDFKKIVCSKKNPDRFEYAEALQKNIIIAGILILMSVLIVVRFVFFVIN